MYFNTHANFWVSSRDLMSWNSICCFSAEILSLSLFSSSATLCCSTSWSLGSVWFCSFGMTFKKSFLRVLAVYLDRHSGQDIDFELAIINHQEFIHHCFPYLILCRRNTYEIFHSERQDRWYVCPHRIATTSLYSSSSKEHMQIAQVTLMFPASVFASQAHTYRSRMTNFRYSFRFVVAFHKPNKNTNDED